MKRIRFFLELPFVCLFLTGALTVGTHTISWHGPAKEKTALSAFDENQPKEQTARVTLTAYCSGCHQSGRSGMDFDAAALDLEAMRRNRFDWERVVEKLKTHEMPPAFSPQPSSRNAKS